MNNETAQYVVNNYSHLLNIKQKAIIMQIDALFNVLYVSNPELEKVTKENGWLNDNETLLDLLRKGYDAFEIRVANRIIKYNNDKVFLNLCPKCSKLVRTPYAKQCRHCSYNWQ